MLITSPTLHEDLRPHLQRLLARIEQPAVALRVDDWWADLAPGLAAHGSVDRAAAVPPTTIVAIDALRTTASPTAPLDDDGRVLFAEVVRGPAIADFDVSGFLWSCGISVIDVVRPVIDADGSWEFAIGVARHTPVRQMPEEPVDAQA